MNQLPTLRAKALEAGFLGVRTFHRLRPVTPSARRSWPVFRVGAGAVALTVDDGPDPRWTPALLDLLARHRVPATFFLIGDRVAEHPELARRIVAAGHRIGNHSLRHPMPFAALDADRLHREINHAQQRIHDATGVTARLFRAPSGGWSTRVLAATVDAGLTPVDWTVNSSDWKEPGVGHITRTLSRAGSGHVLLCHDGGGDRSQTIAALGTVIPRLLYRGLRFVPVPDRPTAAEEA
ncbi:MULTISPECIES: polysaccharide deacetylase family protein [unclassified Solwaraspora]|uniref:polysaccharide deacetylase family protein n=1 Tax=unclassified Solwaraspora TaxID=2627926 RepID=UPI00248BC53B|nr:MULTISPECIES: polysaccharide deacetylase family protein [unclassified Solwaraspora]WBB99358.1 polysaccharide deacetylase family protein [Solwaraspora sp. WMMA2059]WBC22092.1 polysaccharide deacetylase family protein [Solwaraspora sp. WMMA2080]WJK35864.1 polysaccharide deacetylase family protein [Solwaraspora sp. WMMA2065]